MTRIPESVKVGAHTYRVERAGQRKLMRDGKKLLGDAEFTELKIRLLRRMRKSKVQEILLHELLHCCGYPMPDDDERVVETIAPVLLSVLKENPELIAYLTDK